MGIRFFCPNGHKLNVKAHLAGKIGFCPECGARLQIPLESTRKSSREGGGPIHPAPVAEEQIPLLPVVVLEQDNLPGENGESKPVIPIDLAARLDDPPPMSSATHHEPLLGLLPLEDETSPRPDIVSQPVSEPLKHENTGTSAPVSSPETQPISSDPRLNLWLRDKTFVWYIQVPGGPQYGPVQGGAVIEWIQERRIGPEMLVWREDWPEWKKAIDVFPELALLFSGG